MIDQEIETAMMEDEGGLVPPQSPLPASPIIPEAPPAPEVSDPIEITDEIKDALFYLFTTLPKEDDEVRAKMVPIWEIYEYYWRGIQDVLYDKNSNSVVSSTDILRKAGDFEDAYIGQKVINIYRAHGESIAAALAAGDPVIRFFPEDADQPKDIATAKAYSAASEFISEDNDSKLLHLRALYIRWNQPFVAYYNTYVYDEKFGTILKRTYRTEMQQFKNKTCPSCGMTLDEMGVGQTEEEGMMGEMSPSPMMSTSEMSMCPMCNVPAIEEISEEPVPVVDTEEEIPRGKEVVEVYGPRHVRVPYNIKTLEQASYLILETEHHWAQIVNLFPQLQEEIKGGSETKGNAQESRRRRTAAEALDYTLNDRTLNRCWFRPWTFSLIADEDVRAQLKVLFPNGVQCTFVDDIFCEAYDEDLDKHWTIVPDPFAEHIHGDPLGKVLLPIQDMRNDLVQLTLETILFGIAETFADPEVLNFKEYSQTEKKPGNTFPAVRPNGMGLDAGFFQPKAATLSDNVEVFRQSLDNDAQFTTKDFPGIFGGPLPKGSSRTAEEYSMAKQSALQSLSTIWRVVNVAWAQVQKKSVDELRRNMIYQGEDLKFVKEAGSGFKNIHIRLAEIAEGSVGRVKAESSEAFPITWEQQWARLTELLGLQLEPVTQFILSPQNYGEFSRAMGLRKFKFPGEEDRDKQLEEIQQMMTGVPVEIEQTVDDHNMHALTIKIWANGDDGRQAKQINPEGYMLVMQHLQMHEFIVQQQQAQMMAEQEAAQPTKPPKEG